MDRQIEVFIDNGKLTKKQALHEAKNLAGVGNGMSLLASQLVNCRHDFIDEHLFQSDKKRYIQSAIARGIYEMFLAGSVLWDHIDNNPAFLDEIMSLLETKPYTATVDGVRVGRTSEERILWDMMSIDDCDKLIRDIGIALQTVVEETGMEGRFDSPDFNLATDLDE